ncbi:Hypothetical protein SSO8459 [Saccharolobus solfataricus P2]|uniref:Uncharacterized protein n=2 Tax=Saccharolobus solfataricus TaxID=2287 RepID=Q97XV7_SACS2|nr:Hypothetical protein SSO8459 [Saccharolobus solfataricus P2]SAI85280.1 uncharacterised protein [Saccharolobus solfataricus]
MIYLFLLPLPLCHTSYGCKRRLVRGMACNAYIREFYHNVQSDGRGESRPHPKTLLQIVSRPCFPSRGEYYSPRLIKPI